MLTLKCAYYFVDKKNNQYTFIEQSSYYFISIYSIVDLYGLGNFLYAIADHSILRTLIWTLISVELAVEINKKKYIIFDR